MTSSSLGRRIRWTLSSFVALAMLLITAAATYRIGMLQQQSLETNLSQHADHQLTLIARRIEYLLESIDTLVTNPLIIGGLTDPEGQTTYLPKLVDNFSHSRHVQAFALVDFSAEPLFSTLDPPPVYNNTPLLRATLAQNLVNAQIDHAANHLVIYAPIEYYQTTIGALVVTFDLPALLDSILSAGEQSYAISLLHQGQIFYRRHSDPATHYVEITRKLTDKLTVDTLPPPIRALDLSLRLGVERQVFLRPIYAAALDILLLGALITGIAFLVALRVSHSIARPILLLCQRVAESDGSPARRCAPLGTHDELETLARLFDERTNALRMIQDHLEQRVDERTRRLTEAQHRLEEDLIARQQIEQALIQAKERAEQADRAKSRFLANMSHEIRTPMNAVLNLSRLALQTDLNNQQRDYIGKVLKSGQHLLAIINDILDFSKIEAGKMTLETLAFDLNALVQEILATTPMPARDKPLQLRADCAPEVPQTVTGDPLRLRQVLHNLLSNAMKFTEQGQVLLSVDAILVNPGLVQLEFSVCDTGIGMTREQVAALFQAFHQADDSISRRYGGTGLGLVISRRLLGLMDSELYVESTPATGTTFSFTLHLPVAAQRAMSEAQHRCLAVGMNDHIAKPIEPPAPVAPVAPPETSVDITSITRLLNELARCLDSDLMQARKVYDALNTRLARAPEREVCQRLGDALYDFDTDAALVYLQHIAALLEIRLASLD